MSAEEGPGLCARLNARSKQIHKRSNALLLAKVAALFADREEYGRAIGCFYPVFAEMEAGLRAAMNADKRVGQLRDVMPPMWRTQAYEQDLAFYLGKGWRERLLRTPAVQAYVDRLQAVAREQPVLLLAHTFTQHTAGLSGGRVVKKMCQRFMGLEGDEGTAIFTFPGGVELKDAFKARLDEIGAQLSEEELQAVLEEHVRAFQFNIDIMRQYPMSVRTRLRALRLVPAKAWASAALALVTVSVVIGAILVMHSAEQRKVDG